MSRRAPAGGAPIPGPLGTTDVLDGMFALYRASARQVVGLSLAVLVPTQLVVAFTRRDVLGSGIGDLLGDPALAAALLDGQGGLPALLLGVALVEGVVGPLLAGAWVAMAAQAQAGQPGDLAAARRVVAERGPALVGAWWLHALAYAVPVTPAVIAVAAGSGLAGGVLVPVAVFGALALMPLMALATPAVVLEGLGPLAALRRSASLVRRRYMPVFGVLLATTFVIGLLALLITLVPDGLGLAAGGGYAWVLLAAGATMGEVVAGPLVAHAAMLIMQDVRARVEGHDLVERARRRRPVAGEVAR